MQSHGVIVPCSNGARHARCTIRFMLHSRPVAPSSFARHELHRRQSVSGESDVDRWLFSWQKRRAQPWRDHWWRLRCALHCRQCPSTCQLPTQQAKTWSCSPPYCTASGAVVRILRIWHFTGAGIARVDAVEGARVHTDVH